MTATGVRVFQFDSLRSYPLRHAMSLRDPGAPGAGDAGYARDNDHRAVDANRRALCAATGIELAALTLGQQTHGARVAAVTARERGRGQPPAFDGFPATDGLMSDDPAVALGVIVADCVPLVLYDPRRQALAVVHAGWRGTVAGIAGVAARALRDRFGSEPSDLVAGIGPSIGPCCYEVGDDVIAAWRAARIADDERAVGRGASYHFDLWTANRQTLLAAGLRREAVEISGRCTRCERERLFSYRAAREGLSPSGRMLMIAQLAPDAGAA